MAQETGDAKTNGVLIGGVEKVDIRIVDYDPRWPELFRQHAARIAAALGPEALSIEHIGSTSVPDMPAKPIIDILVVVKDSAKEESYLPALVAAGYQLRVREPDFHQHRMLRTPTKDVHIHVFSAGSQEIDRYLVFRDRLRTNSADHKTYADAKRRLARNDWSDMNAYANAKTSVVEQIIGRGRKGS
jgi:GrpB-like predicted nucleotidyltransferase (UPF0157 family)